MRSNNSGPMSPCSRARTLLQEGTRQLPVGTGSRTKCPDAGFRSGQGWACDALFLQFFGLCGQPAGTFRQTFVQGGPLVTVADGLSDGTEQCVWRTFSYSSFWWPRTRRRSTQTAEAPLEALTGPSVSCAPLCVTE